MTDNIHIKKKVTLRTKSSIVSYEEEKSPKVTLKRKHPAPKEPLSPEPPEYTPRTSGKGKWVAAALAGLLVLGGGGYYLSQQGSDTDAMRQVAEVVEDTKVDATATDESKANNDETAQGGDATADAAYEVPSDATPSADDGSPAGDLPSNTTPSAPVQKKESASTPATSSEASAPKADAPANVKPSKPAEQPKTEITSTSTVSGATGTIKEEALEVIRGKYGTNPDRRRLLGNRYPEIQKKVNEMYKNRRFY